MSRKFYSVIVNFNSVNIVFFYLFFLRLAYGWPKSDVAGGERVVADVAGRESGWPMAGLSLLEML